MRQNKWGYTENDTEGDECRERDRKTSSKYIYLETENTNIMTSSSASALVYKQFQACSFFCVYSVVGVRSKILFPLLECVQNLCSSLLINAVLTCICTLQYFPLISYVYFFSYFFTSICSCNAYSYLATNL